MPVAVVQTVRDRVGGAVVSGVAVRSRTGCVWTWGVWVFGLGRPFVMPGPAGWGCARAGGPCLAGRLRAERALSQ